MTAPQFVFTEAGRTPSGQQLIALTIPGDERVPLQHAGQLCMWPDQWNTLRLRLRGEGFTVRP